MSTRHSTPDPSPASNAGSHKSNISSRIDASNKPASKRKRPQSCDTCRSRKIKCVLLQVEGLQRGADHRCVQCRAIDAKCTFDYVLKRPGPQSNFAKTAKKQGNSQTKLAAHGTSDRSAKPVKLAAARGDVSASNPASSSSTSAVGVSPDLFGLSPSQHQPLHAMDDTWYRSFPQNSRPPSIGAGGGGGQSAGQTPSASWNGTAFDSYMFAMTPQYAAGTSVDSSYQHHSVSSVAASGTPSSLGGPSPFPPPPGRSEFYSRPEQYHFQQPQQLPTTQFHLPISDLTTQEIPLPSFSRAVSPTPSYASSHSAATPMHQSSAPPQQRAIERALKGPWTIINKQRPRSLDDVAPRHMFLSMISIYFHYLWPLLPIVHRPTFSKDLLNRRDERDQVFLAFVLSLTSYTVIQCPRTVLPGPWSEYRKLHRDCHAASQRLQTKTYDPALLLHVNTLYCDHIYLGTVGKKNAANAVLGEAFRVALILGLHDQTMLDVQTQPAGVNNSVERELRKRTFWVLHGSSTTVAVLLNQPVFVHQVDICLDMPLAVEEHSLQPTDPSSSATDSGILSGFLAVTQLHQIMLEVLESYRRDRRYPTEEIRVVQSRFAYLASASKRVKAVVEQMPLALQRPTFVHSPPVPIRKPGSAFPSLDTVSKRLQKHEAQMEHNPPAWPWPADTFTLPEQPEASMRPAMGSRRETQLSSRSGSDSVGVEGAQAPHRVLTPIPLSSGTITPLDQVNMFRPTPPPSTAPILSPMSTMHANVIVTESLICFLLAEYHALISQRMQDLALRQSASAAVPLQGQDVGAGWQDAAANVLRLFNNVPLDALASNGQSLIDKIMYIVSSLLKRTADSNPPTLGYHYMSSLLLTLTKLSQTRTDDYREESVEEPNASDNESGDDYDSDSDGGEDRHDGANAFGDSGRQNGGDDPKSAQDNNGSHDHQGKGPDTRPRTPPPSTGNQLPLHALHSALKRDDDNSTMSSSCPSSAPSTAPTSADSTACSSPSACSMPLSLSLTTFAAPRSLVEHV